VNRDVDTEVLISGTTAPFKATLVILPLMLAGFTTAEGIRAYWFPDGFDRAKGAVEFFLMFLASGSFSFFVLSKLMDKVYAQVGLLSLKKGKRLITIHDEDIQSVGVFRGTYGCPAWLRIKTATGRGRLVFFMASDNYAISWPSRTATRFLWNKLNEPLV
jgi:hypothetical protein